MTRPHRRARIDRESRGDPRLTTWQVHDIQMDSLPAGDYLFTAIVSLNGLLELVARFTGPPDTWPETGE
jgi:hypothetical protein